MTVKEPWYVKERSESLAIVYLTRHPGVEILRSRESRDLDLIAVLREREGPSGRFLGVVVQAEIAPISDGDGTTASSFPLTRKQLHLLKDVPFPVCLFFFTLRDDAAYWGWAKEPVVSPDDGPALRIHERVPLVPLTTPQINTLVSAAEDWYAAQTGH